MIKSLPVYPMTLADCIFVCSNMREECFKETASLSSATTKDGVAMDIMRQDGESYTIRNRHQKPILVGGTFYRNPGVATIWLIATNEISHRDWWVTTKFITGLIEVMFAQKTAHRIQAESIGWRHHAHKWLKRIGLTQDGQLKGFSSDGYDVLIFGKTKE
jgi:hypothetical protein